MNKRNTFSIITNFIPHTLLLIALIISLPELLLYRGALYLNSGVSADVILWLILAFLLAARLVLKVKLSEKVFAAYFLIFLPFTITFSVLVMLLDSFIYSNFFYSTFHLSPDSIFDFTVFLVLFSVPVFDINVIRKYWKQVIFNGAVFGFALFIFLKWRIPDVFYLLDNEDQITEYTTALLYFLAGVYSLRGFLTVRRMKLQNKLKYFWLFILFFSAIGLFIVTGEELSWGQRIFNIATPEGLRAINQQEELNLHNTSVVFKYVYDAYLVLGYWGMLSWALIYLPFKLSGIRLYEYFTPVLSRWYLAPYFLIIIVYVLWRYHSTDGAFDIWEETAELFPATGILFIYILNYLKIRKIKK